MTVKYQLKITAHTPRGTFGGTLGDAMDSREDVQSAIDGIERSVNQINHLTIVDDEVEVCLNKQILQESVLTFRVVTVLVED